MSTLTNISNRFPHPRTRPVAAGLVWAALFLPAFAFLRWLSDDFEWPDLILMAPLSIVAGIAWSFFTKWYLERDQRGA